MGSWEEDTLALVLALLRHCVTSGFYSPSANEKFAPDGCWGLSSCSDSGAGTSLAWSPS